MASAVEITFSIGRKDSQAIRKPPRADATISAGSRDQARGTMTSITPPRALWEMVPRTQTPAAGMETSYTSYRPSLP